MVGGAVEITPHSQLPVNTNWMFLYPLSPRKFVFSQITASCITHKMSSRSGAAANRPIPVPRSPLPTLSLED